MNRNIFPIIGLKLNGQICWNALLDQQFHYLTGLAGIRWIEICLVSECLNIDLYLWYIYAEFLWKLWFLPVDWIYVEYIPISRPVLSSPYLPFKFVFVETPNTWFEQGKNDRIDYKAEWINQSFPSHCQSVEEKCL